MNKTFDFKRFGKYFRYDVVSAWQNAGASLLTIAAMPLWLFLIVSLFQIVFTGHFGNFSMAGIGVAYGISLVMTEIFFPVQHYGKLTDRKPGSDWVLLPASRFEKFLSMLLVTCVVVPAVWLAVIASCDGLLTLAFNNYQGMGLVELTSALSKAMAELHSENIDFVLNGPRAIYLSFCASILTFTLGAIFFRKNKIVYTFLSIIAVSIVITIAAGIISGGQMHVDTDYFNEDRLMRAMNALICLIYFVEFAVLDVLIYLRVKTIKH